MNNNSHQKILKDGIEKLGIEASEEQIEKILLYIDLLLKWNKTFNLTSIVDPNEVVTKHILDSLSLAGYLRGSGLKPSSMLDVGCGAGFPGIPCAIFLPDTHFQLVDAVQKKIAFVRQVCLTLKLTNVEALHGRVESGNFDRKFDVITSRAFSSLENFTQLTEDLIAEAGVWLALKAKITEAELSGLSDSFLVKEIVPLEVPYLNETRNLVVISKKL